MHCNSCQAVMINGVFCHEVGCPMQTRRCPACLKDFQPEVPGQRHCKDCNDYWADEADHSTPDAHML